MKDIVRQALEQGYVYFICYDDREVHKGFIEKYYTPIYCCREGFDLAYGVHYYFNWRDDLWLYDCDDLIQDITKHELYDQCYSCGLTTQSVDCKDYGKTWALTKEELKK